MTTQVAPAAMSTAWLAGPLEVDGPDGEHRAGRLGQGRGRSEWVVASSIRAYPRMKPPAQKTSWAMRATGAVGARMASLPS